MSNVTGETVTASCKNIQMSNQNGRMTEVPINNIAAPAAKEVYSDSLANLPRHIEE